MISKIYFKSEDCTGLQKNKNALHMADDYSENKSISFLAMTAGNEQRKPLI